MYQSTVVSYQLNQMILLIDAWNLNADEPVRLQIAKMVFDAVLLQKNKEGDNGSTQPTVVILSRRRNRQSQQQS